jgi:hypothetical protein
MAKINIFALTLIFLLSGCAGATKTSLKSDYPAAENVSGSKDTWDFGEVSAGEVLKHVFTVKNVSAKIMNITQIDSTCGCTVTSVDKKRLFPAESAMLEVNFNSFGYKGQVTQYVYAQTDNLDNPILRFIIKAYVK